MSPRHEWSEAECERLRRLYLDTPMPELVREFGRDKQQIYGKAQRLGLRRSEAFLASTHAGRLRSGDDQGAATRFAKGQQPWNAGLKGYQAGGRSAETRFKKGQRGNNYAPIGSERVRSDGYRERKMTDTGYPPRDWVPVHLLLWREHYGEIPAGHVVVFRDKDRSNITIDNLELISRGELARRNAMHTRFPPELKAAIRALGSLRRQLNKKARHEKQD